MKLFFLPYAGSTSMVFRRYMAYSDIVKQCEIVSLDIPGRGLRMADPFCQTIDEAAEDLAKQVASMIEKKEEYLIAAHSLGCLLAYELMYKLEAMGFALPVHLFFSGKNAPDTPVEAIEAGLSIDLVDDETIIEEMLKSDNEYVQIYKNKTVANAFIPILRADYKMIERYVHQKKDHKLTVDITYFFSIDDPDISIEYVRHWQNHITGNLQMYYFQGGHFFFFKNVEILVEIMLKIALGIEDNVPY